MIFCNLMLVPIQWTIRILLGIVQCLNVSVLALSICFIVLALALHAKGMLHCVKVKILPVYDLRNSLVNNQPMLIQLHQFPHAS